MKRIIITTLTILAAGALAGWILINNRNKNEAKTAVVARTGSAVAAMVSPASKQPIKLDFSANGSFSANQDLELLSETSGRITEIRVKAGSRVSKGQVLAVIDSEVASLDVKQAEDAYQKLTTDYRRYQSSFETGGVTKAQLDDIELSLRNAESKLQQSKRRLNDAVIKAPIAGVINSRSVEVGSFVSPGTKLFEIVDGSRLKLNVTANEYQVVHISLGDRVSISSNVFPDAVFEGIVSFIAEKADNTMKYPVEITVENTRNLPLKSGMYATAKFEFPEEAPRVVIDRNAFIGSVNSNRIYVYSETDQTAKLREVVSGRIIGEQVEILSGLEEGEMVITSGQINLNNGTRVEALTQ
ncbi:efflux RND transporter periplasmic adaptor subunit [Parapedobacter deserti]|uniref:Efflux RND transporter periplasmic adaptor subunit n=1 Tax=Parapedobacter deserti TaxID=1912957 RepID=A0ABV7JI08_9SPHI